MSKERQRLADGLLRAAETRQQCAVTHSRAMRAALERRRASRQVTSPVRGLYVRPAYWSSLDPAQKALHVIRGIAALRPKTVFSHTSAALVHGLPVSWHELGSIHVMRSPTSHRKGTGLFVCHSSKSFEAVSVRGVRVTPLVRTAIDCMRALDFPGALAVADAILARTGMTRAELLDEVDRAFSGSRGVKGARRAAAFADPRSESGGESRARAAIIEGGFAVPELQARIVNPLDQSRAFRVDFLWQTPQGPVAGEFDGLGKYEMGSGKPLEELARERRREALITQSRMPVLRLGRYEVTHPDKLAELLEAYGIPKASAEICDGTTT